MPKKLKIAITSIVLVVSLALAFVGGCNFSLTSPTTTQTAEGINLDLLNEAYDIVQRNYVDPNRLNDAKLTEGAIKGMVDAIEDPHSAYLTKEEVTLSTSTFQGQFEGIGASVSLDENSRIVIIAPIAGSPAEKAGIKPGDIILEIDGKSTVGMSVSEAVLLIRGPKGTTVTLNVLHKDTTGPVTIEIIRAEIEQASVHLEMRGDIAYIQITQFTERTEDELIPVLETISQNGAKGIIIDLRSNPGGIVDIVVANASHFLENGAVAYVVDRNGNKTTYSVQEVTPKIELPMIVLVDENSASASEIFTGAIQDHSRGVIAGVKTYGKGSVNILTQLSDGSGIYITIGRWLTPDGHQIEGEGIEPDQMLDLENVDAIQWAIDYLHNNSS